jgi:hypothetical protein
VTGNSGWGMCLPIKRRWGTRLCVNDTITRSGQRWGQPHRRHGQPQGLPLRWGMWWVRLNLNPSLRFCIRAGSNNRDGLRLSDVCGSVMITNTSSVMKGNRNASARLESARTKGSGQNSSYRTGKSLSPSRSRGDASPSSGRLGERIDLFQPLCGGRFCQQGSNVLIETAAFQLRQLC